MTTAETLTQQHIHQGMETLQEDLEQLFTLIAPTWPLAHAVACNPLQGLEKLPFAKAVRRGQELFDANTLPALWQIRSAAARGEIQEPAMADAVSRALETLPSELPFGKQPLRLEPLFTTMVQRLDEREVPQAADRLLTDSLRAMGQQRPWQATLEPVNQDAITWLGAFLDEGQAAWPMPFRERGFFRAVKSLLLHQAEQTNFIRRLPEATGPALLMLLRHLGIDSAEQRDFLRDHLMALPGWASYIRWRSEQADYAPQQRYSIDLEDYLAVRLLLAAVNGAAQEAPEPAPAKEWSLLHQWAVAQLDPPLGTAAADWASLLKVLREAYYLIRLSLLESWEQSFRTRMADDLRSQLETPAVMGRPEAQLAFCIDVRSEPFRRQLESCGQYETLGFAGFFGLPIAYQTVLGKRVKSLPVLLQPAHELKEVAGSCCTQDLEKHQSGLKLLQELKQAYKSLKYNIATPFAAVEALGLPAGLITIGRSLIPGPLARMRRAGRRWFRPEIDLLPDVSPAAEWGIPMEQQIAYAGNALRMMGLTRNFAPLVVLCGHGSQTENNPYAAALDCGACGGSHGGPNAAAMASILNQKAVREALAEEGIVIPADTLFVGAEHNTTTDAVRLIDLPELDAVKQVQITALRSNLAEAQQRNLNVRAVQFGLKDSKGMLRRSADWSEVRPEWGLAGNAGFVVAPRHMTANLDLKGRCFLHSYDWSQDPESKSLEVILTAPLVVAQWINNQYFFSTVDNTAFGSGSKVTHNVVGKIGIMQGNGSDLMHGLPWQSVMKNDEELYHKPLRLTAFVVAPRERVQMLVEKHEVLQKLLYNAWIALEVLDPETSQMWALEVDGAWREIA
ncbi:MAG: DUF2309 domain-containing protein [Phaeodactylibacter sp.]|uniref:DUF2309 domain-containing protein n=1 Tax=Phaeodactylibacter sp. TaxID=1940289 RepID=UPI0032EF4A93